MERDGEWTDTTKNIAVMEDGSFTLQNWSDVADNPTFVTHHNDSPDVERRLQPTYIPSPTEWQHVMTTLEVLTEKLTVQERSHLRSTSIIKFALDDLCTAVETLKTRLDNHTTATRLLAAGLDNVEKRITK